MNRRRKRKPKQQPFVSKPGNPLFAIEQQLQTALKDAETRLARIESQQRQAVSARAQAEKTAAQAEQARRNAEVAASAEAKHKQRVAKLEEQIAHAQDEKRRPTRRGNVRELRRRMRRGRTGRGNRHRSCRKRPELSPPLNWRRLRRVSGARRQIPGY